MAWTLAFLALYDVVVGWGVTLPKVPAKVRSFFDYGLSIEEKYHRAVGLTPLPPSPIRELGFLEPPAKPRTYGRADAGALTLSFYGMSFSEDVGRGVARLEPGSNVRAFGAPSAAPNHALADFEVDPDRGKSDVAVLGVLGSSVAGVLTRCMTWYFVAPYPYTYPRYLPRAGAPGGVEPSWPLLRSYEDFHAALVDPAKWEPFVDEVRRDDPYYDPFLFRRGIADRSTVVQLIRKAWAQRQLYEVDGGVHTAKGFIPESESIRATRGIVLRFGAEARAAGALPIVLLLGDRGYDGHLDAALGPTLREASIPFISTHETSPSTDPRNLVGDGHFTDEANDRTARALLDLVASHRRDRPTGSAR
jgi:hypothetical protein